MKVILRLGVSYSNENKPAQLSTITVPPKNSDVLRTVLRMWQNRSTHTHTNMKKITTICILRLGCRLRIDRVMIHEVQNQMRCILLNKQQMTFLLLDYVNKSAMCTRL